ncbi:MAG: hypothetical protein ABL931_01400 [Usitatibacteraceae bacterium]
MSLKFGGRQGILTTMAQVVAAPTDGPDVDGGVASAVLLRKNMFGGAFK